MNSLDFNLLKEAKEQFYSDFKTKVENLGYSLSYSITGSKDSLIIGANIQDPHHKRFSKENVKKIKEIFPKEYHYKGHKIPLQVALLKYMKLF